MHVSAAGVVLFASVIGYLAFLLWYGGRGRAMDASEADSLLEQVRAHAEMAAAPVAPELLESLRDVTRDDDGHEFVMVNLIKYRQKAVYPPGYSCSDDPHAADRRYNRAVVPLLLSRACLPVFLGRSAGRFLAPDGAQEWDSVVLVRYRSRRDLLGMCAGLARTRARHSQVGGDRKNASVSGHCPVQPDLDPTDRRGHACRSGRARLVFAGLIRSPRAKPCGHRVGEPPRPLGLGPRIAPWQRGSGSKRWIGTIDFPDLCAMPHRGLQCEGL